MRSTTHVYSDREKPPSTTPTEPPPPPPRVDALPPPSPPLAGSHSLERLLSEAQYSPRVGDQFEGEVEGENGDLKNDVTVLAKHLDVNEEEGWITIPYSTSSNLFT